MGADMGNADVKLFDQDFQFIARKKITQHDKAELVEVAKLFVAEHDQFLYWQSIVALDANGSQPSEFCKG